MWSPYISCGISDIWDMVLHVHTHIYICRYYMYTYIYIDIGVCIHIPLRTSGWLALVLPCQTSLFPDSRDLNDKFRRPKMSGSADGSSRQKWFVDRQKNNIYRLTLLWSTNRHTTDKRNASDRQIGMLCTTFTKWRISGELLQWDDRQTCVLSRVLHHPWFA